MIRKLTTWGLASGAVALGAALLVAQPVEWTLDRSDDRPTAVSVAASEAQAQTGTSYETDTGDAIEMLKAQSRAFAALAEKVLPSVVSITSSRVISATSNRGETPEFFGDNFFRRFFDQMPEEFSQQGSGSGVIVSDDGFILTNNHVVADADELEVTTSDGSRYQAELIGRDERSDIAVIKIDAPDLRPATLALDQDIRVGEWVFAAGNPFRLSSSITYGIVSATGRTNVGLTDFENFIQTDAAINPGNSGGALVNLEGNVVGINTAIATRSGGYQGIGFAIPIKYAKRMMDDLITEGRVVRGFLGVQISNVDAEMAEYFGLEGARGAIVTLVTPGSPAEDAGIEQGDIILEVEGAEVKNVDDLRFKVSEIRPGVEVDVRVRRDDRMQTLQATLAEWPEADEPLAQGGRMDDRRPNVFDDLGFELDDIDREVRREYEIPIETEGVVVTDVDALTPASKAGFRRGDVVVKAGNQSVDSVSDIERVLDDLEPGDPMVFLVQRGQGEFFLSLRMPTS